MNMRAVSFSIPVILLLLAACSSAPALRATQDYDRLKGSKVTSLELPMQYAEGVSVDRAPSLKLSMLYTHQKPFFDVVAVYTPYAYNQPGVRCPKLDLAVDGKAILGEATLSSQADSKGEDMRYIQTLSTRVPTKALRQLEQAKSMVWSYCGEVEHELDARELEGVRDFASKVLDRSGDEQLPEVR